MNHARASGAPISVKLGEQQRTLRRLSRRDFGVLIERMPVDKPAERMFLSPFDVHRWSQTVDGSALVVAMASLPKGYAPEQLEARLAEVQGDGGEWGSFVQQVVAAGVVTAESITTGEEPETSEGEQRPDPTSPATSATTSTKPA